MTITEQILATLHDLPPERQVEVLDFADFLRQRSKTAHEAPAIEPPALPVLAGRVPAGWKDAVYDPH
jgi:hypothetical protein